jgi:hypothetical protein
MFGKRKHGRDIVLLSTGRIVAGLCPIARLLLGPFRAASSPG